VVEDALDLALLVHDPCSRVRRGTGSDFEVDQIMLRDALATGGSANILYMPFVTKIDIFGLGDAPTQSARIRTEPQWTKKRVRALAAPGETRQGAN
jgi:hypothetical protein